jgi:hypothetical protein
VRGERKVNTQWLLYCLVHSIGKVQRYGVRDAEARWTTDPALHVEGQRETETRGRANTAAIKSARVPCRVQQVPSLSS